MILQLLTHYHIPAPNTALNGYVSENPVLRILNKELGHVHDRIWIVGMGEVYYFFHCDSSVNDLVIWVNIFCVKYIVFVIMHFEKLSQRVCNCLICWQSVILSYWQIHLVLRQACWRLLLICYYLIKWTQGVMSLGLFVNGEKLWKQYLLQQM